MLSFSFLMFYGSGVFGTAFSFPVCLRYKLLCVRDWVYYGGVSLGESVQLALSVCGGGVLGCIFGLNGMENMCIYHLDFAFCTCCFVISVMLVRNIGNGAPGAEAFDAFGK